MHQRPFCLEQLVERLIQIFPKRSFIMILLFASDKVPSMKTAHKDAKKNENMVCYRFSLAIKLCVIK